MTRIWIALVWCVLAAGNAASAAQPAWGSLEVVVTGRTVAGPAGWLNWCMGAAERCLPAQRPEVAPATPALLAAVERVQRQVNAAISPRAEPAGRDLWQHDADHGDCEDFALAKQHKLRAAGLPHGAVRLATARLASGELHAVVTVETDRGTLVLDNLHDRVMPVASLDYSWLRLQGTDGSLRWRELAGAPAGALGPRAIEARTASIQGTPARAH